MNTWLQAILNAIAALSSNGLIARTGSGAVAARTVTGTSNRVTVTNGDGVSGDPTLTAPQDLHTSAQFQVGNLGVGSGPLTHRGISVGATLTGSTSPAGVVSVPTFGSGATVTADAVLGFPIIADAAFTCPQVASFRAVNMTKGAAATVTTQAGLVVPDLSGATNNYGMMLAVSAGSNKRSIRSTGTALSDFGGQIQVVEANAADVSVTSGYGVFGTNLDGTPYHKSDAGTKSVGLGLIQTAVKNADYTAAASEHVLCNASTASATFAVTLPSGTPAAETLVMVSLQVDDRATAVASRKSVTIDRNGNLVDGSTDTEKWRLLVEGDWILFRWVGGDVGWAVTDGIKPQYAKYRLNATQTGIVTATFTEIDFDTSISDDLSIRDTVNGRFYAARGCNWRVDTIGRVTSAASQTRAEWFLYKNGARHRDMGGIQASSASNPYAIGSAAVEMAVGDYVETYFLHTFAGNNTVVGGTATDAAILEIVEIR